MSNFGVRLGHTGDICYMVTVERSVDNGLGRADLKKLMVSHSCILACDLEHPECVRGYLFFKKNRRATVIKRLIVHSQHRGQGIGDKLLSYVLDRYKARQCSSLEMLVDLSQLNLLNFLKRRNFVGSLAKNHMVLMKYREPDILARILAGDCSVARV